MTDNKTEPKVLDLGDGIQLVTVQKSEPTDAKGLQKQVAELKMKAPEVAKKTTTSTKGSGYLFNAVANNVANKQLKNFKSDSDSVTAPVFVFREQMIKNKLEQKLEPKFVHEFTLQETFKAHNTTHYLVGYDIEYQSNADDSKTLVSHQFYFTFPPNKDSNRDDQDSRYNRFGVVIITDRRMTATTFLKFIRLLLPKEDKKLSKVYVAAHFSLIECGWLIPTFEKKEKTKNDGTTYELPVPLIKKSKKQWKERARLCDRFGDTKDDLTEKFEDRRRKQVAKLYKKLEKEQKTPDEIATEIKAQDEIARAKHERKMADYMPRGVWAYFVDSLNLEYTSLGRIGENIGIPKLDPINIEQMKEVSVEKPQQFARYGIYDSIITAEAFAYYGNYFKGELGIEMQPRMAKYSEVYFKEFFIKQHGKCEWKHYLGWSKRLTDEGFQLKRLGNQRFERVKKLAEANNMSILETLKQINEDTIKDDEIEKNDNEIEALKTKNKQEDPWQPSPTMMSFYDFYYGGRNEVLETGPRGTAIYYDLKSAYPTAVTIPPDYNFSNAQVTRGAGVADRLKALKIRGPFQVAGVVAAFKFKKNAAPMFPVRLDNGLVFPRTGHSHIMWPEFWVALKMDILESYEIYSVHEFENLKSYNLADDVYRLLEKRTGDKKMLYKNLLNYFYGKTAQGTREMREKYYRESDISKAMTSSVTCFPLAAYMTSFCRAVIGELLNNKNRCYGITTDGFISPEPRLKTGPMSEIVSTKLKQINFDFIEREKKATKSLFLKTRGYILINEEADPNDAEKYLKLSAAGVQVAKTEKIELQNEDKYDGNPFDDDLNPESETEDDTQTEEQYRDLTPDERVADFLTKLNAKKFDKVSWPGFKEIRGLSKIIDTEKELIDLENPETPVPTQKTSNTRINTTFDMKRIPQNPKEAVFSHAGVDYHCTSLTTVPIYSVDDFNTLRRMAYRNMTTEEYKQMIEQAKTEHNITKQP